jgi:hypothetical protein
MRARSIARGALLGAAILIPTAASAVAAPASSTGVVVNYRAHSTTATVATPAGKIIALHTGRVRAGTRVRMTHLRKLNNGTLAGHLVVLGSSRHATVRGVVAARIGNRGLALSARGTTVAIRLTNATKRSNDFGGPAATTPAAPAVSVGSTVTADVTITPNGEIEADDITVTNTPDVATFELEGAIKAVGTGTAAPAVDPATGCVAGLNSAALPAGWMAVSVGEKGLSLTAFVQVPADPAAPAATTTPATTTTTTTTTAPTTTTPPVAVSTPAFSVGQEVDLRVSEIMSTTTGQACENQFQLASASQNGDAEEADDDGGDHHGGGDSQGGGHHGGGQGGGGQGGGDD